MDILYFAFANDQNNRLDSLEDEAKEILRLLEPGANEGRYIIKYEPFATRENILDYVSKNRNQLALFHYSGHAGKELLHTEEEVSHAVGIAQLLGQCERLKLVFLNGCSTQGQLQGLQKENVPAIIATSSPVSDKKAVNVARRFYRALSSDESIEIAFKLAQTDFKSQDPFASFELTRGFFDRENNGQADKDQWGFFVLDDQSDVLKWKLPDKTVPPPTSKEFAPNKLLIDGLTKALAPFSDDLKDYIQKEKKKEEVDLADKRMAILNCLPAPIAEQLRKLMVPSLGTDEGYDKISKQRAFQLTRTFDTIIELFTFTWLAQLWESKISVKNFKIDDEQLQVIREFFKLDLSKRTSYSFIPLIRCLRETLEANQQAYFIEEWGQLKESYAQESDFAKGCYYLETLKARIFRNELADHEVHQACKRAEQSLTAVMQELGFLAKYTLAAVRMIDVVKFRHDKEAKFKHSLVKLVKLLGGLEEKVEEHENYMDSRSVLLLKKGKDAKGKDETQYLNLSPFVIDENAFDIQSAEVSKVYFYYLYGQGRDEYELRHAYKPGDSPLLVSSNKYPMIKAQFDAFANLFFNTDMENL